MIQYINEFYRGSPLSKGHSVVWVNVDWLIKYAYFLSLAHPDTTSSLMSAKYCVFGPLDLH
jgi:DNA-binding transcriptional regulator of glucitol operon